MKRLALFAVAAALVVTGLSYYSGTRIERDFETGMAALSGGADFPGQISTRYERGLFGSTAKSEFRMPGAQQPAARIEHSIAHGPIPWAGLRHGARPGSTWVESEIFFTGGHPALAAFFTELPPLRVRTRLGATRGVSELHWPAFQGGAAPGTGTVAVSELNGEIHFGGPKEEAYGSLEWGGLKMDSPLYALELKSLHGEFAYEDILKESLFGQSSFRLEQVMARSGGQPVAELHDFTWSERRRVENGKLSLHSALGIGSLGVMRFELKQGVLETQLEKIDLSVWEQVRKMGQSLAQSSVGTSLAATGANTSAIPDEAEALRLLQTFLAADPSLSLQLAAQVNGQALSANSSARFGEDAGAGGLDPQALLRHLEAHLAVEVPTRLLDGWLDGPGGSGGKGAQLRALRDQGILRRGPADVYVMRLEFRRGELHVNGVPYRAFGSGPGASN